MSGETIKRGLGDWKRVIEYINRSRALGISKETSRGRGAKTKCI